MPAITLSSAAPNVTLTGLNSAYGTIGSYYINFYPGPPDITEHVEAAIFGTQTTNFNILNTGTILSTGTSQFDAGIVLGGVGAVKNTGTIIAPAGIFILGYRDNGAYASNFGTIIATKGEGIDVLGAGGVNNSGFISAATAGIFDDGGLAENFGTIVAGEVGLSQRGDQAVNAGLILATGTLATGVVTYGFFTNTSTAAITANGAGIFGIDYSITYNDGTVSAAAGIVLTAEASFYNTGLVSASGTGIYQGLDRDPYTHGAAYITNYAGGIITGKKFGIQNTLSSAYIYNAGLITGATAVTDNGIILNSGTIKGTKAGIILYSGTLTNTGTISGNTAIDGKRAKYIPFTATITNQGKIIGQTGILAAGGFVTNAGHIEARSSAGIELTAAGQVYNGVLVTNSLTNAGTLTGTIIAAGAGVSLAAAGTVTNTGTIISGGADGVDLAAQSALYNKYVTTHRYTGAYETSTAHFGTIAAARYGVSLAGAGYIYNQYATISGGTAAIYARGAAGAAGQYTYIYNHGSITGGKYGILSRSGTIDYVGGHGGRNLVTGGTAIAAVDAYIRNTGYVDGTLAGIFLTQGGTIINQGGIRGGNQGSAAAIYAGADGATIINAGRLFGIEGVVLAGAGYLYNQNGAQFQASTVGVDFEAGGTVINDSHIYAGAGYDAITIAGGGTVINRGLGVIGGNIIFGTGANRLVLDPGSRIEPGVSVDPTTIAATVDLNGGILELGAASGSIGTLLAFEAGGASAITIDKAANWSFASGEHFAAGAKITNNGTIRQLSGAGAAIAAAITGRGAIDITAGTITLDGAVGKDQKVKFLTPGTGELALGAPAHFAATVQNFGLHETIDLTSLSLSDVKTLSFSAGILTLTETAGTLTFTFSNPTHFAGQTFAAFAEGLGTGITLAPAGHQNSQSWLTHGDGLSLITLQA